jgi:hypothetical protein
MDAELKRLAEAVSADPRDALAVLMLADRIEEMGGDPSPVRELFVGDGDVLVFGWPGAAAPEEAAAWQGVTDRMKQWFTGQGRNVFVMAVPAATTIRQVKAAPRQG